MNTIIRPVKQTDAADILAIYAPYVTDTVISFETKVPTIEEFSKRIETIQNDYPYLVCEVDGKVVGYAYASKHRERAAYRYSVEVSVYVALDYHHKGIGKALYKRLFAALDACNYYSAYAGITLPNDKSIGLHKSFGFVEVGIYHNIGYKDGKWLDVIWLEKPLKDYGIPPGKGGDGDDR
ncbi:MAG: N-acetyltransferase [Clostridiales bacterium]|nr:N-acetyltransferase [Clostridiales bacterium]